eukprot:7951970-Pyramimonas_sp.AAC.1
MRTGRGGEEGRGKGGGRDRPEDGCAWGAEPSGVGLGGWKSIDGGEGECWILEGGGRSAELV